MNRLTPGLISDLEQHREGTSSPLDNKQTLIKGAF
jgi:hypothetical protein